MPTTDTKMMTKAEVAAAMAADYKVNSKRADTSLLNDIPTPDSFAAFGRLVLKIAMGEINPARVPDDVMRAVLDDMGIKVPDDWKIVFRRRPKNTFTVMYPSKPMAQAALARLQTTGSYTLPRQYSEWQASDKSKVQDFYEFRVGDYTLNFCRD